MLRVQRSAGACWHVLEQLAEDARVRDAALRREARHETLLGRAEFEIQENFFFFGESPKTFDGPFSAVSKPIIYLRPYVYKFHILLASFDLEMTLPFSVKNVCLKSTCFV